MPKIKTLLSELAKESGVEAIIASPYDTKLLCAQRFVRLFAYGTSFLILVHFLTSLDISDARVGLFMTLTLLGDVVISFCLTLITDKVGRRKILAAGAALMAMSGVVFSLSSNYWFLVLASVVGVISPRHLPQDLRSSSGMKLTRRQWKRDRTLQGGRRINPHPIDGERYTK